MTENIKTPFTEALSELRRKASALLRMACSKSPPTASSDNPKATDWFANYIECMKTYTPASYGGRDVTPRELSLHGWKCIGRNNVKCMGCDRILSTILPRLDAVSSINVYDNCLKHLREKLVSGHQQTCRYRNPRIEFHSEKTQKAGVDKYMKMMLASYESFDSTTSLELTNEVEDLLDAVYPNHSPNVIKCALLGWKYTVKNTQKYLHCELCNRQIMIRSGCPMNPVTSHYNWCPVRDVNAENEPYWTIMHHLLTKQNADNMSPISRRILRAKRTLGLNRMVSVVSLNEADLDSSTTSHVEQTAQ